MPKDKEHLILKINENIKRPPFSATLLINSQLFINNF